MLVYIEPRLAPSISAVVLVILGVVALWRAYRVLHDRRHTPIDQASTADVETRRSVPVPGTTIDRKLARLDRSTGRMHYRHRTLVTELEEAAIAVLVDRTGTSPARAREEIRRGTWTTDPVAAAFLGDVSLPLRFRIRRTLLPGDPARRHAERTIDAIVQLHDAERNGGKPFEEGRNGEKPFEEGRNSEKPYEKGRHGVIHGGENREDGRSTVAPTDRSSGASGANR